MRFVLILGGLALLAAAWVFSQLPRAGDARIEASPGVTGVHDGQSYAWILKTQNGALLVDTGGEPGGEALLAELARQGVKPEAIQAVLLTHSHKDHWGAAHLFPNAQVYVGPGEAAFMRGARRFTSPVGGAFNRMVPTPPMPKAVRELEGGETLELDGASVRVFHVPGHTPGSLMFLVQDLLFTGDSLLRAGEGVGPPPRFVSDAPAENRRSLSSLAEVPFTRIADGHTGLTLGAREKLRAALPFR